jgi:nucleotide-binding universal stress UspA family protein
MIKLKRILVATDFGEAAGAALNYGRELARNFGASLTVLHVIPDLLTTSYGIEGYVGGYPEYQRGIEEGARKQLESLLSDEDRREFGAIAELRTSRSPALAIVNYARDLNADIIIMGTHGRGAMTQLLMGSVAERVVRTAPCPVLTVKHPEHEFVMPDALMKLATA